MTFALLAGVAGQAAADTPRVHVAFEHCDPRIDRETSRIAAIELHARPGDADASGVTLATVTCNDGDTITIHVVDPLTSKSLSRTVSIAGVDERARPRTIALAVAELISASWVELETNPEPKVQSVPPRVRRERPATVARVIASPLVLEAVADVQVFFQSGELALGGGARFTPWITHAFLLRVDALAHHAEGTRVVGDVTIDTFSSALAAGTGITSPALRFTATLGIRGGYARIVGSSRAANVQGHVLAGGWLGPELAVDLELFPHARVHPVMAYALGWAIAGVDGVVPGDRDVRAGGPWGSMSVGIATN